MKENYYAESLSAQKLYQVYETRYPRVKQYLDSEITFVRNHLQGTERVVELGAGYGRIIRELASNCRSIVGIDISKNNVDLGKEYLRDTPNAYLMVMDAHNIQFQESFDVALCLQNALSAMKAEPIEFVQKVMAMLSNGGKAFFSSYSAKFWEYRLAWFQEQAEKGLLGEIDMEKTKNGIIICKDGFHATTYSLEDMDMFGKSSSFAYKVNEVDESSIFLIVTKN